MNVRPAPSVSSAPQRARLDALIQGMELALARLCARDQHARDMERRTTICSMEPDLGAACQGNP